MSQLAKKEKSLKFRHFRIRKKINGTTDRPRLCIHRSLKNLNAQIIDDSSSKVIIGMSTLAKDVKAKANYGGNVAAATAFGEAFAQKAKEKGITKVSFDRGGFKYHGRIKAFADAARKGGLEF